MRLLQIETENVLGLADGTYPFAKRGEDALAGATIITGASGAGKTSLLAAIAFGREVLAGYGPPERPERLLRAGVSEGNLRIRFELDETEAAAADVAERNVNVDVELAPGAPPPSTSKPMRAVFGRFGERSAVGALEYFPDNRAVDPAGSRTTLEQEKRLRPGRARQKYAGLVPWLQSVAARAASEPEALRPMRSALEHLSPGLELVGLDAGEAPELVFKVGASSVPLPRLSSSQLQAVLLAGTIVRFGLETGLLLIDQPELHQSTDDHVRFVRGLAEIAHEAQLIIATGSSAVSKVVRSSQLLQLGATPTSASSNVSRPSSSLEVARVPNQASIEMPTVGPSALASPLAPAPSQSAEVAPASPAEPPRRDAGHSTPSYLQQQARSPAPYVPIAAAPPPAPQVHAPPPVSPPRVVIRPYEPPAPPAAPGPATGTEEMDASVFRMGRPVSAEDAAVIARMKQGSASGDATAFLSPIAPPAQGANQLPFRPGGPSAPSPALESAGPRAPTVQSGLTMAGSSGARPSMPFMRAGAPNPDSIPPGWSIQRYAALCIDLHASGLPEERVLAMAQITRDQRVALDNYWQARMTQEPSLRAEWKAHADRREAEVRGRR